MPRYLRMDATPQEARHDVLDWLRAVAQYLDGLSEIARQVPTQTDPTTEAHTPVCAAERANTFAADAREYASLLAAANRADDAR